MWLCEGLCVQLLVVAGFLAVLERNMRKGLALHAERKPFGYLSVTPACAGLGSLVDDLLEQIGASLGECDWPKPGSMEARLALTIWLKVLFFMMFPFIRLGGVLVFFSFLWPLP